MLDGRRPALMPWPVVVVGAALALGVLVPLVLSVLSGSISLPHNDAWAHSLIAQNYANGNGIELVGWNRTALVGQIVVLGPLGASITAQQAAMAVLGLVGLMATYDVARHHVTALSAAWVTLTVAAVVEYGLLSTSFMSDMPAFAGSMVSLACGQRAYRSTGRWWAWWLAAMIAVGWAVTVREQSAIVLVVLLILAGRTWSGRQRTVAFAVGAVLVVSLVCFEMWRRGLPYSDSPTPGFHPDAGLRVVTPLLLTVGLSLAPVSFVVATPRQWRLRSWIGAALALVVTGVPTWGNTAQLLGNYLDPRGAYAAAALGTRSVLGAPLWWALVGVALVSLAIITGEALRAARSFLGWDAPSLVAVLVLVATLGQATLGQSVFARYLLLAFPCVAILLLRAVPTRRWALGAVPLVLMAGVTLTLTSNALAFDAARWSTAEHLVAAGVPASDINAGLEWVGYHASTPATPTRRSVRPRGWWMSLFPASRECWLVAASPLPGLEPTSIVDYPSYVVAGTSSLYVYRNDACS